MILSVKNKYLFVMTRQAMTRRLLNKKYEI